MRLALDIAKNGRTGYGNLGWALRKEMEKQGVTIDPKAPISLTVAPPFVYRGHWEGQEPWCFTMFESTRLPEVFTEQIDNFAGVFVPNEFNREQYSKEHPNVHKIPLGFDPELYFPYEREVGANLNFLFIGRGVRKAGDIAERAFKIAFPNPDSMSPRPVLVTPHVRGQMTDSEIARLYYDAHCYIAPSRGEGWHLLPFQMLATGGPVILSDNPGHTEWASNTPGAYLVPTALVPSIIGGAGKSWAGEWWETDPETFAAKMLWVYENYSEAHKRALRGAEELAQGFTWERACTALLGLLPASEGPSAGDSWVEPKRRRFLVTPTKTDQADIAGVLYRFTAGQELSVSADAKRVLLAADMIEDTPFWVRWEE